VHAVLTALAAACALAVAANGGAGLAEVSVDGAGPAAAVLATTALACWLGLLVLTALPRLALARTLPARALALAPSALPLTSGGSRAEDLVLTPARRLTPMPRSAQP